MRIFLQDYLKMAKPTIQKVAVDFTLRKDPDINGNSRALASKRLQLQKRHTVPVIRNPGTTRERTMLLPERKLPTPKEKKPKEVMSLSPLSDSCFDFDEWKLEDDELGTKSSSCTCKCVF